ncbi:MAG TPA: hypothetical protein VFV17_04780, partial [Usitatibacteraceae bacterium]|nr:hypothetical protein [Usitatibacteraceae bacterium]
MRTLKLTRIDAWRTKPPSPPHALQRWLTARGSLSARLAAAFPGFAVQRLRQELAAPFPDERRHLGARRGERCVV